MEIAHPRFSVQRILARPDSLQVFAAVTPLHCIWSIFDNHGHRHFSTAVAILAKASGPISGGEAFQTPARCLNWDSRSIGPGFILPALPRGSRRIVAQRPLVCWRTKLTVAGAQGLRSYMGSCFTPCFHHPGSETMLFIRFIHSQPLLRAALSEFTDPGRIEDPHAIAEQPL